MLETIINNLEAFIVRAIEIILVIAVVLQRTKISRKVKEMEETLLKTLTIEQLEAELKRRKEEKLEKIEKPKQPEEDQKYIEYVKLKEKLYNIIGSIDETAIYEYAKIKNYIKELKQHNDKFAYPKRIEKLIEIHDEREDIENE